jgi:D-erythronate 2-dehydrogenase
MNILITGADGFVGRTLVKRLLESTAINVSSLHLLDKQFKTTFDDARVKTYEGDFFDAEILRAALEQPTDIVFHLASIPGGAAERNYELGKRVNLEGTLELFEALRRQSKTPIVVFASTIAVYGSPLPDFVDANTPTKPNISYGTQKLIGELLLSDYSRRGFLDGRALRLPGIVARPQRPSGLISAFMSDILRKLSVGESYTCPVSPEAVMWWMSARCCADNFIHAATLSADVLNSSRVVLLPALRATMRDVVAGLAERFGENRLDLVRYEPNENVEAGFGRFPPMDASVAEALGFRHDGSVIALIKNALKVN